MRKRADNKIKMELIKMKLFKKKSFQVPKYVLNVPISTHEDEIKMSINYHIKN